jgi:Holliday junction DNA helicase RuvB
MRTPRGRVAGKLAYQHYGLKAPERLGMPDLFA